eukprot:4179652-Amphidinium_carterae.1
MNIFDSEVGRKGAMTPGEKEAKPMKEDTTPLDTEAASRLGSAICKLMWLVADRPHINFMVNKVAR